MLRNTLASMCLSCLVLAIAEAQELPNKVVEFSWKGGTLSSGDGRSWGDRENWNAGGRFDQANPGDVLSEIGYSANVLFQNFSLDGPNAVSEIETWYRLERVTFRENGPNKAFVINSVAGLEFVENDILSNPISLIVQDGIFYECGSGLLQDGCDDTSMQTINAPIAFSNLPSSNYEFDKEVKIYNSHNRGNLVINGEIRAGGFNSLATPQEVTTLTLRTDTGGDLTINGAIGPAGLTAEQMQQWHADILNVVKSGFGEVYLGGSNTYTGTTTINDGRLLITGSGRLPDTTDVYVNKFINSGAPGVLQYLINGEDSINGLYGNGTVLISRDTAFVIGQQGGSEENGKGAFQGTLDGAGKFVKRGAGTQTLVGTTRLLHQSILVEEGGLQLGGTLDLNQPIDVRGGHLIIRANANSAFPINVNVFDQGQLRFANESGLSLGDVVVNSTNGLGIFPHGQLSFNSLKMATEMGVSVNHTQTQGLISAGDFVIGDMGHANYTHSGDIMTAFNLLLGRAKGSVGQYTIDDNPMTPSNNFYSTSLFSVDMEIGRSGVGLFNQRNSSVGTERLTVGTNTTDPVIVNPDGDIFGNNGGTGTQILFDDSTSRYTLSGGTLTVTNTARIGTNQADPLKNRNGEFIQSGGSHNASKIYVGSSNSEFHRGLYELNGGELKSEEITLQKYGVFDFNDGNVDATTIVNHSDGFNFNGGTLSVDEFRGTLENNGGILSPGNSPGYTFIDGDYVQKSGQLLIEISGIDVAENDFIEISGAATLHSGSVIISFIDNFLPTTGFSFDFLSVGRGITISDLVMFHFLGAASDFQFEVNNIGERLQFVALSDAAPVPVPPALLLFGSSLIILRLWKQIRRTIPRYLSGTAAYFF